MQSRLARKVDAALANTIEAQDGQAFHAPDAVLSSTTGADHSGSNGAANGRPINSNNHFRRTLPAGVQLSKRDAEGRSRLLAANDSHELSHSTPEPVAPAAPGITLSGSGSLRASPPHGHSAAAGTSTVPSSYANGDGRLSLTASGSIGRGNAHGHNHHGHGEAMAPVAASTPPVHTGGPATGVNLALVTGSIGNGMPAVAATSAMPLAPGYAPKGGVPGPPLEMGAAPLAFSGPGSQQHQPGPSMLPLGAGLPVNGAAVAVPGMAMPCAGASVPAVMLAPEGTALPSLPGTPDTEASEAAAADGFGPAVLHGSPLSAQHSSAPAPVDGGVVGISAAQPEAAIGAGQAPPAAAGAAGYGTLTSQDSSSLPFPPAAAQSAPTAAATLTMHGSHEKEAT